MWSEIKSYLVNHIARDKLVITTIINKLVLGNQMVAVPTASPVLRFTFHIGDVS